MTLSHDSLEQLAAARRGAEAKGKVIGPLRERMGEDNAEVAYALSDCQSPWVCSSSGQKSTNLIHPTPLL
jgi:2-keto-4-pentenoate hydratase